MHALPTLRLRTIDPRPVRDGGRFILYWMTVCRRPRWNFALQRSVALAAELGRPLVVVEVLTCGGRWDSDRHHAFVLQGMADNARHFHGKPVRYYPFVERRPGQSAALFAAMAEHATAVVTDDHPLPPGGDPERFSKPSGVRIESVDSNGLLPLRAAGRDYPTAYSFRRFLQRALPDRLVEMPIADPLARVELTDARLPGAITARWPAATPKLLSAAPAELAALPIDHAVGPVAARGGPAEGRRALRRFVKDRLPRYVEQRNEPEAEATSGLSPYLHHGHVSAFEAFDAVARHEDWSPDRLADHATGKREGWWGMGAAAEAFLDELVTWREVGYNFAARRDDVDRYASLPDWAAATLAEHAGDRRPYVYSLDRFEAADTHDPLWNAAQRQLLRDGIIHNYLRMLWGKKILEWTPSPEEALEVMIELNNKYAIDGRDPNSYSGIFWVLGRYDRAWGPERAVFGKVRYMSSENTARKVRVREYQDRYAAG